MKSFLVLFLAVFTFGIAPSVPGLRSSVAYAAPAEDHDHNTRRLLEIITQENPIKAELVRPEMKPGEHWVPLIKLTEEVSPESVGRIESMISSANEQNADAIVLEINTPGGSVWSGFDLARAMEDSKAPIACVVDGMAASMGYYLLQSCTVRMMTPRSVLMAHEPAVYGEFGGQQSKAKNLTEQLHALSEAMLWQESYRLNVSMDYVRAKTLNGLEWWMNYREARKVKAIDEVVKSVKSVVESYKKDLHPPHARIK